MKKGEIIVVALLGLIATASVANSALGFYKPPSAFEGYLINSQSAAGQAVQAAAGKVHTVAITATGFQPQTLAIALGDTVRWVNRKTVPAWPASDVHPTHAAYPGSAIGKCSTAEKGKIFDACAGLAPGESFSFAFGQAGSWDYHDHLNPAATGAITVAAPPTQSQQAGSAGTGKTIKLGYRNYGFYFPETGSDTITLKRGERATFEGILSGQDALVGCMKSIRTPWGSKVFRSGDTSFSFTPDKAGPVTFTCGMGMGTGRIIVEA